MKLASERVDRIFNACLSATCECESEAKEVEGIIHKFAFNPARLERHRTDIIEMLRELPKEFHEGTGDGWSFLNACLDRHGNQWTGLHLTMEKLFVLGLAIGKVQYLMPREMWSVLPGGMPYLVVLK